jgi:carbon-monoxide dehydrogenase medium subunit
VKAAAFDYLRPGSLPDALRLLREGGEGARLLAGGQSLIPALNLRLLAPAALIDINRLAVLRGVTLADGVVRIGALTRHAELLRDPLIARHAPLLRLAAPHIAHAAIRNRGTIGGSLAHADPAAELPACVLALGAHLVLEKPEGRRSVPADAFFQGLFTTALAPDEILVAVEIDAAHTDERFAFRELARRQGDYAMAGVAARARATGDRFTALDLAYFAVGATPRLAQNAAAALLTDQPLSVRLDEAAVALAVDLDPHDDLQASAATRLHLSRVLLRRVVDDLLTAPA